MDKGGVTLKQELKKILKGLEQEFEENRDDKNAYQMSKYMRNKFEYFGLQSKLRKDIQNKYIKELKSITQDDLIDILEYLWSLPESEFQYVALDLMKRKHKLLDADCIPTLEKLIVTKSWWDTVDGLAPNGIGVIFKKQSELIKDYIEKWMNSGNFWLQRTCLLYQLKYKNKTDKELLFDLCKRLSQETEFFIRKAIGWSLREYSKTDPKSVKKFIENNELSNLSVREGMKVINRKK